MTTAHIFYVPVIFFVGLIAGFFLGQRVLEEKLRKRREKRRKKKQMASHPADGD